MLLFGNAKHLRVEGTLQVWCAFGCRAYAVDNALISEASALERVVSRIQPCLRAVASTERRVAKVFAPAAVRKPTDIFIFTFIIRMSCSA